MDLAGIRIGKRTELLTNTDLKEMKIALVYTIERLPEQTKLVLSLYHVEELTIKEIGKVLNKTESEASQIHSQAIKHLRARLICLSPQ